jgi:pimeloyl-ACP methyl ester carboxylesterase
MRALIGRRRARHLAFANLVRHPTLIDTAMLYELIGGRGAPALRDAARAMMAHDIRGELAALDAPTLIVHGREDMLVPLADSHWLAQRLPHAQLDVFEDTGHLVMLERPVRFNEALARFAGA